MTIKILRLSDPFTEVKVEATNKKSHLTIGVKIYPHSQQKEIHKEFFALNNFDKISRLEKRLEILSNNTEEDEDTLESEISSLKGEILSLRESGEEDRVTFLKKEVLFIKGFSFPIEDETGKVTTYTVKDSREVTPLGSLWETPDECLAVLLDNLLEEPIFREPILQGIMKGLFNFDFAEKEVKNSKKQGKD